MGGGRPTAKFDLGLFVPEMEGRLAGYFEYATDLFDGSTIERLAGHLQTLLGRDCHRAEYANIRASATDGR